MPSLNGLLMNKMSSTATKLPLAASRVLLLSTAVFIFLSGAEAKEIRKCYWCGPLAEQVHRSQRAPPCNDVQDHVTNCDPEYTHCAVVATSPPFVESRLCVKLYQDECYSLFCNSTKTWRMICPCRGDLCNGPNSEREKEAFKTLLKLSGKTNNARVKRAIITLRKLIDKNDDMNNMITETIHSTMPEANKDVTNVEINNATDAIQLDQPTNDFPKEIIPTEQVKVSLNIDENEKTTKNLAPEPNDDPKQVTEAINTIVEKSVNMATTLEDTKLEKVKLSTEASNVAVEEKPNEMTTLTKMVVTTEKMPTAEALQQNKSPIEKLKEPVTTETTLMTTSQVNADTTEFPNSTKNNTATTLQKQLPTLIAGIILNQYL